MSRFSSLKQRSGKKIISHQHGHFVVIDRIHRTLSATFATLVDHIVVNQRSRVEKLERDSRTKRVLADFTQFFSHQQHKDGAHHLALTLAHVVEGLSQEVVFVSQRQVKQFLICSQFLFHRMAQCR